MHYLSPFSVVLASFGAWHIRLYNCWRARMRREPDVQIIHFEEIFRASPATVNRIVGGETPSQNTSTRCRHRFFFAFLLQVSFQQSFPLVAMKSLVKSLFTARLELSVKRRILHLSVSSHYARPSGGDLRAAENPAICVMTFDNRKNEISLNIHGNVRRRARKASWRIDTRFGRVTDSRGVRFFGGQPREKSACTLKASLTFRRAWVELCHRVFRCRMALTSSQSSRHQQSVTASPHKSQESSRWLSISSVSFSLCEHKLIRCGAQNFREIDFTLKFGRILVKRVVTLFRQKRVSMPSLKHDPLCLRNGRLQTIYAQNDKNFFTTSTLLSFPRRRSPLNLS